MLQAQTLNFVFRKTDIIGRLGGDEFAVIAPGTSKEFVEIINKKLLVVNKKLSAENDLPFELSMSIAAVEFSEFNFDIDTLLNMADEQMYLTKKQKKSLEK
jgi:diguanylate cyclase (GGDEF)-like protein